MMATTTMMECPVCASDVDISPDTVVNELLDCGECASELEVVALDPPKLAEAPEVAEDWGE
ncbi:MAG: lysine biosynthesis protein LysW [Acidobacteriota bacterium]|nr:MAG: lysine biosynthesis protein LysW [Acidobacteriota bacterium]